MECPGQSFRLAPSRRLLSAVCALHLAALAGLAATALPARGGGTRLEFRGEAWWLHDDGAAQPVRLRADSAVLPFLIVLRVQQARRVRSLLVLGDSLPRGELRRLRVLLRLRGAG
jgi:hypothetical protein